MFKVDHSKKETVLIIDDNKLNIMALIRILGSEYTIYFEDDAAKGIQAAKAFKPDLILLDVVMPDMTGFEVIKILKNDDSVRDVPVIFLTGRNDVQDEELGLVLGAVDYIRKPFSASVVMLRVGQQLKMQRLLREVYNLSVEDALTGLGNRRHFNNTLLQEWQRSARQQLPLGFMVLDIDHFKKFNDTYGHVSGDAVLKTAAAVIKAGASRATDHVARWGGEEFAVILYETDLVGTMIVAENIRQSIASTVFKLDDGVSVNITVSVGAHSIIAEADSAYTLKNFISDADAALYEAKNQGRNRVVAFKS